MKYIGSEKESNKRTSLVPTRRNRKDLAIKKDEIKQSNIENENVKKFNINNEDILSAGPIYNDYNEKVVEKVVVKNTTTKSVETISPDGFYRNATQTDEKSSEYIRYGEGNRQRGFSNDVIDIYPTKEGLIDDRLELPQVSLPYPSKEPSSTYIDLVSRDGLLLEHIKNQTLEICTIAVKQNGLSIKYVNPIYKNKMIEILAVKQNGLALEYIEKENQTDIICLEAVRQNGLAIRYVQNQKNEVIKVALNENWLSFHYILNKNREVYIEAVKVNGLLLEYIKEQDENICLQAVNQNPLSLEFVLNQNENICNSAILKSGLALKYVKDKTSKLCLLALSQNSLAIKYIPREMLSNNIDLKDYVFVYSDKCILISAIKEVRGLKQINLKRNETGYLIINAFLESNIKTSFVIQKDEIFIDDQVIDRLREKNHFVEAV
ncbi:MAG: DUF4116 domain-containing protein [Romboutsia sp.]